MKRVLAVLAATLLLLSPIFLMAGPGGCGSGCG